MYRYVDVPNKSNHFPREAGRVESSLQFICSFLSQGNASRQTLVWSAGQQCGGPVPRPFVFIPVQECKTIIIPFRDKSSRSLRTERT